MPSVKIIALAGSAKQESLNKKLARTAARGAEAAGAEVTFIDLRDYPMPLVDEDLESRDGLPDNCVELKRLFREHHGMLLACPEYNSSITPLLKNTIDWVSRPMDGEPSLAGFQGKVVSLMSASGGSLGGLRGLVHVRSILGNIDCIVLPKQLAVTGAHKVFDDNGNCVDEQQKKNIEELSANTVAVARKLAG